MANEVREIEHQAFEQLDELLDLYAAGREHAAMAIWTDLAPDFRVRVLKFVLFVRNNWDLLDSTPNAVFQTKYGLWKVSRERIELLNKAIPELAQATSGNC